MTRTRNGRGLALAVAAAALSTGACGKKGAGAAGAPADSVAVQAVAVGAEGIVVVQPEDIATGPAVSGSLKAEREAQVRAQVGGSVLQTYAEKGQAVAAGAPLARLDDSALRDSYLSGQSAVHAASAALEVARRNAERTRQLNSAGAVSDRDLEAARSQLSQAQAAVADARSREAAAQKQLSYTVVRSPISGIVSERPVNAGDVVQPGGALYTVVDPASMRLEAAVPAEQIGSVRPGSQVRFTVSGYPGREFTGTVRRINPAADPVTRQVPIYVSIPNAEGRLVSGLFAEGRVVSATRHALGVPLKAIDQKGIGAAVMRVRRGRVERVPVQLGIRDEQGERVEVTQGLAAGDTVLMGAAMAVNPGTPVRVGATPAKP